MWRPVFLLCFLSLCVAGVSGQSVRAVVADSVSRLSLPSASVFDRNGRFAGITRSDGKMPYVSPAEYPVTIRYIGYREKTVPICGNDTIFMVENSTELSEVTVESRGRKILHMLAYVREYSMLTTYTDTVFLFREKMADYMLPPDDKGSFRGWSNPRVLSSKSYYRFTNAEGLDSVSDRCNHHFSWADWMGVPATPRMPARLRDVEKGTDTVKGKYSLSEIWGRNGSRLSLDVDVLADASARRWVPGLASFFRKDVEFGQLRARFNYENIAEDSVMPVDLAGYSFNIESDGRGHGMFMFNRVDEPYSVSTYAEVYMIDKEYITVKEARKWERRQSRGVGLAIMEPPEAPELQPAIMSLIERVNNVDHDLVKLGIAPDRRLVGRNVEKLTFERAVLQRLKGMLGIDYLRGRRKWGRDWKDKRRKMVEKNRRDIERWDGEDGGG